MADEYLSDEDVFGSQQPQTYLSDADVGLEKPGLGAQALDVAKQIPSGLVTGTEAIPAAPAQILGAVGGLANRYLPSFMVSPEAAAEQANLKSLIGQQRGQGIANYLPAPQTTAGQYARTAAEFVPSAAGAPGGLATNIGAGIAGGLASEGAGQLTAGTPYEVPARVAGALVGTGAAQKLARLKFTKAYAGSPVQAELADSVDARYGAVRDLGAELKPAATAQALRDMREAAAIDEVVAPRTNALLEKTIGKLENTDKPATFDSLETLRRQLGKLGADPIEREAAKDAQIGIHDWLANIEPEAVASGDATQIASLAKVAREEAAANFRMKAFDALRERAELAAERGQNAERAYRNELSSFVRPNRKGISPALKEGFNQAEISELRSAARLTTFPQLLRFVGAMGGHGWMGIGAAGVGAYGVYEHNPFLEGVGAVGLGGSFLGRSLGTALMRARADRAARMVAARSPLAREMGVTAPAAAGPGILAPTLGTVARPGLYNGPPPQNFARGGRVLRSFRIRP